MEAAAVVSESSRNERRNSALETLLQGLERLARKPGHPDETFRAFSALAEACRREPAITRVARLVAAGFAPGPSREQAEKLVLALFLRTSSTYGAIPKLVSDLAFLGFEAEAAIVNRNAFEEIGDGRIRSHASLLEDDFRALALGLNLPVLSIQRYALTRAIKAGDARRLEQLVRHLQSPPEDVAAARRFASLFPEDVFEYHELIERTFSGPRPCLELLPAQVLEFAVREAGSTDDEASGDLSFIGAWQILFSSCFAGGSRSHWAAAHKDADLGQANGWAASAEEGHAADARELALRFLGSLSAAELTDALTLVERLEIERSRFWELVCRETFPSVVSTFTGKAAIRAGSHHVS